ELTRGEAVDDAGDGGLAEGHLLGELARREHLVAAEDAETHELRTGEPEGVRQIATVDVDGAGDAPQRDEDVFFELVGHAEVSIRRRAPPSKRIARSAARNGEHG